MVKFPKNQGGERERERERERGRLWVSPVLLFSPVIELMGFASD